MNTKWTWITVVAVSILLSPLASLATTSDFQLFAPTFTGAFDWNENGAIQSLEFRLSRDSRSPENFSALITSKSGAVQAVCDLVQAVDRSSSFPESFDFTCHGASFGALQMPASLILTNKPLLRFGSWLKGYQQAPLRVQMDGLTTPLRRALALTQR